jgi:hypothetical protein
MMALRATHSFRVGTADAALAAEAKHKRQEAVSANAPEHSV